MAGTPPAPTRNTTGKARNGQAASANRFSAKHGSPITATTKKEATRGIIEPGAEDHPILNGVADIFGDTDVYTANPPPDAKILVRGQVLAGMKPSDPPVEGRKNDPMQPVVWLRNYRNENAKTNTVVTTTMGSATDIQSEGFRRLLVNAAFWALGLKVPENADVTFVGNFKPTMYGFNEFVTGVKPSDHELK